MASMELGSIVIANGSDMIQAGKADQERPQVVFPSIVGRPRDEKWKKQHYVGDEAEKSQPKSGPLTLNHTIEHGIVNNWEDMEKLWKHCYDKNKLNVDPEKYNLLMIASPFTTEEDKERMVKIAFDTFKVPKFYVAIDSILSLSASGERTTGIVLDIGYDTAQAVPLFAGVCIPNAAMKVHIEGNDLADYLMAKMKERMVAFSKDSAKEMARDIKEKLCYVINGDANSRKSLMEGYPLHELVYKSIMKCDKDDHEELFGNIVLSGCSTMSDGFPERLEEEIKALAPDSMTVKVIDPKKYDAWIGGSKLVPILNNQEMWITRGEYEKEGPCIVHRKCCH